MKKVAKRVVRRVVTTETQKVAYWVEPKVAKPVEMKEKMMVAWMVEKMAA